MATAEQIKDAIERCVERAKETETETYERARHFVARLSGSLEVIGEQALADKVFSLLRTDGSTEVQS